MQPYKTTSGSDITYTNYGDSSSGAWQQSSAQTQDFSTLGNAVIIQTPLILVKSQLVTSQRQATIFIREFRLLRDAMIPNARNQGIITDQDVFDRVS
jgi:hypothetical protein